MKNKNELIASSKHLYYEIWMLRLLANKLLNYSVGLGDTEEENENIVEIRAVTHTSSPSVYCYSTDVAYSPPSVEENDLIVGNALLESFGIHLRSLINFFYPDKKRSQDDDVSSHHYFQDYHIWEKNRPLHSQEQLNEIIKKIIKRNCPFDVFS